MDWNTAIARAQALAARYRAAGDLLRFCRAVIRFQQGIYLRTRASTRKDPRRLDTRLLASFLPDFLQLAEKYGPGEIAAQAQRMRDRQDWEQLLRACWQGMDGRRHLLPRMILQPYVQYLSERWRLEVGALDGAESGRCPFCSRAPLTSVQNGCRLLVCSLCAGEWEYPAGRCPGCRSERLKVHRRKGYANLRIEACDECGRYLKAIDLRKDPRAVPLVDELAGVELDRMARDRGYEKFALNLGGE